MENSLGICTLSVIPVRLESKHSSEMISQILFGETFTILNQSENWYQIKTDLDNYEGWVEEKQITLIDDLYAHQLKTSQQFLTSEASCLILKGNLKEQLHLTAGSTLPLFSEGKFKIGQEHYQVTSSNVFVPNQEDFETDVQETAKNFLNVPYFWGGRTHFGIDCSGFSQIVFKMLGFAIPRDAWQQAEFGKTVDFLIEAKAGDLAFFDNEEGKITHVGIMLNNSQIIHASGKVKIERIDNQGIFSVEQNKYTHRLRIIKRV
jgi:hypothetical protein